MGYLNPRSIALAPSDRHPGQASAPLRHWGSARRGPGRAFERLPWTLGSGAEGDERIWWRSERARCERWGALPHASDQSGHSGGAPDLRGEARSEEHTSDIKSHMRTAYAA